MWILPHLFYSSEDLDSLASRKMFWLKIYKMLTIRDFAASTYNKKRWMWEAENYMVSNSQSEPLYKSAPPHYPSRQLSDNYNYTYFSEPLNQRLQRWAMRPGCWPAHLSCPAGLEFQRVARAPFTHSSSQKTSSAAAAVAAAHNSICIAINFTRAPFVSLPRSPLSVVFFYRSGHRAGVQRT